MNFRVWLLLLFPPLVLAGPASGQAGRAQSPAANQKHNPPTAASPQELFKRLSPSVFVVETLDKSGSVVAIGSGVTIAPDQVVTNTHVIEEGVAWRITRGRETWPATLTHLDPGHDLCQLKVEGLKAPAVPVRFSSALVVGEHVYAIGAPVGLELTLSEGLISGLREFEQVRLIQTSAAISPGSSGGGLFDAQGRLVGVTTFFLKEGQNLNFALPGEWVQALVKHPLSANQKAETDSFSALAWFQLGYQASEAGEHEKAITAFREFVRLKPDAYGAWFNLGNAYGTLGQHKQAVKAYQEAIRLKSDLAEAWYNLGRAYLRLKQYDQAVETLQETIRLKPDYFYARVNLGGAYLLLKQYDQAVKILQEVVHLKPDDAEIWFNLGFAYNELGQYEQAVNAYQEAVRLRPDYADAWNNLGNAYTGLDQYEQATKAFQEAIRLKPDHAATWNNLGNAYTGLDQYEQGIRALQEAIRLKPEFAEAWYDLGRIYAIQGNRSKVMQVFEKLKTLDPNMADKFFKYVVLMPEKK